MYLTCGPFTGQFASWPRCRARPVLACCRVCAKEGPCHTPWGGEDQDPVVAPPETELERALAEQLSELAQGHHREGSSAGR
jgi:hypothetical protein